VTFHNDDTGQIDYERWASYVVLGRASLQSNVARLDPEPQRDRQFRVTNGTRLSRTGDVAGAGLPTNTWLDLVINGTVVQSSPTFPANSGVFPTGPPFSVEPFSTALLPQAPFSVLLSPVHAGSVAWSK
jgi:hypothetical protein